MAVNLNELSELTTVAADDLFLAYDADAASNPSKYITRANMLASVVFEGGDHDLGTSTIDDLTAETASLTFTDGATLTKVIAVSPSVAPSDITTGNGETVAVTVTGALTTGFLQWAFTSVLPDGLTCQAWISASDEVSFRFFNTTGGTITGASYTARIMVTLTA